MKRSSAIAILLALVVVTTIWFGELPGAPSYLRFMARDGRYYERIADACDELLANVPAGASDGHQIPPANLPLPPALVKLHADYFRITTNRVFLSIGVGRGSYGIAWQVTGAPGSRIGELSTSAESLEKVVFTRRER